MMPSYSVTLVTAPGIPTSERIALEQHVKEAVLDPDYAVILNYEATMEEFIVPDGDVFPTDMDTAFLG